MKLRKALIILSAMLLVFVAFGCKKKKSASETPVVNDFVSASEEKIKDAPNVYLIVKAIDNSYFKIMFEGARHASAKFGCNLYYGGSEKSSEWEAQAALMDIAKERGADAVIIAPGDAKKLVAKVTELYEAGIAIICVDSVIASDNYNLCYMTNNVNAGKASAAEMLAKMKEKGFSETENLKVAIQTARLSSASSNDRIAGFTQYWTENAPAAWEILSDDIKPNDSDSEIGLKNSEEFFKKYENIKGAFGATNSSTTGFAKYILLNNLKDVVLVGFDYSVDTEALVLDSTYTASAVLQRQYDMAYKAVATAIDIKNNNFSSGDKIVDTGIIIANNKTVDTPDVLKAIGKN